MPLDDLTCILQIAPHLRMVPLLAEDGVFLVGECEHFAVRDHATATLIQALDGLRDVDAALAACAEQVDPATALSILGRLMDKGLIAEVREGASAPAAFVSGLRLADPAGTLQLIDATDAADSADLLAMAEALRGAGFILHSDSATAVIVATDYLAPGCLPKAQAVLRSGRACFLMKPGGLRPFLGPYFCRGPQQACPRCLNYLLGEQRPVERLLQRGAAAPAPLAPLAAIPASLAAAANLGALQLRSILSQADPAPRADRLWTLEFPNLSLTEHRVRRLPQCPDCGDPTLMAQRGEQPVTLASVPIAFAHDGGFRAESPDISYARQSQLVSSVLGPVTHLQPMSGPHGENPLVWSSGYRVMPAAGPGTDSFYRRCAGKGLSREQARMSALAEAIERYCAVYRGDEAAVDASYRELADSALHPDQLHLFSAAQQAAAEVASRPLEPDARLAWTPAWSLTENRRRYVPLAYCYSEVPAERGAAYCRPSSNGSAAGNCLEEAILQGLFESVERDAVAIWWYGRQRRPAVAIPPAAAAHFDGERAALARLGWSLWALDLTHDLGIPVVVAVAIFGPEDCLALGFGCHSDPLVALHRAVSELHQVVLPSTPIRTPWHGMAASQMDFLFPTPEAPAQAPAAAIPSRDLRDHILTWVDRLGNRGLELLVVDKSRPDLTLRVAQVIVPGLRHAWPRFAPGRLFTVPVALGWLRTPLTESQLNPQHLLI